MGKMKFEYIPIEGMEADAISILEGKYEGLHYHYCTVKFNELEDGQMEMKFNYNVLQKPEGFEDNIDFKNYPKNRLILKLQRRVL